MAALENTDSFKGPPETVVITLAIIILLIIIMVVLYKQFQGLGL
jgi:hypothetical protein